MNLKGRSVVLGVSGGIAAYKAAELVRALRQAGARVRVVMTRGAQQFVTPLTLQTLSGHPVSTDLAISRRSRRSATSSSPTRPTCC